MTPVSQRRRARPGVETCEPRALLAVVTDPFGAWRPLAAEVARPVAPPTFPDGWLVVHSTADDGPGSFRQAIRDANARPGLDTVAFDLAANAGGGTPTLRPLSALPTITDPIVIDARTLAGTPGVILDGSLAGVGADGLTLAGGRSTVAGLTIVRFAGSGVVIVGQGGNQVIASLIGTDLDGHAGLGNGQDGLSVRGASDNTLGGSRPGLGNVIAGNGLVGVRIAGAGASNNLVAGNAIGTDPSGTTPLPNRAGGVFLDQAPGNSLGGTSPSAGNLISGNGGSGVVVAGAGASGYRVRGNRIGTD
ncbi:MAG: right-handed parallel beta-helix repeat-containing protein, partial [Isosphaeraceae bacterium]